jgi:hypothetical protein
MVQTLCGNAHHVADDLSMLTCSSCFDREDVAVPTALQGGTLRPYQLDGLRFLLSLYNNCLNGGSACSSAACRISTCKRAMGLPVSLSAVCTLAMVLDMVLWMRGWALLNSAAIPVIRRRAGGRNGAGQDGADGGAGGGAGPVQGLHRAPPSAGAQGRAAQLGAHLLVAPQRSLSCIVTQTGLVHNCDLAILMCTVHGPYGQESLVSLSLGQVHALTNLQCL